MKRLPQLSWQARPFPHHRSVAAAALDRPPGSDRRLFVLMLAAITAAVEVAGLSGAIGDIEVGRVVLSASVFPALVLAIACGDRLLGRARTRPAATAFWITAGLAFVMGAVIYLRTAYPADVPGLILAALDEELVYRLAIPAVLALLLRAVGVRAPTARMTGFVLAGSWFVLLPGHREQMHSAAQIVPFVAFAGLSAVMVYRSGSVLAMATAHAVSNLLTILVWTENVQQGARSAVLGSLLLLMVFSYGHTRRYIETEHGTIIDLRTGKPLLVDLRARPLGSDGLGAEGLGLEPVIAVRPMPE
jgi:hypothetical protein